MATNDIRERLARLPHHAVVAFAARCARRVQPLTHVLPQQDRDTIERAITNAEAFAKVPAAPPGPPSRQGRHQGRRPPGPPPRAARAAAAASSRRCRRRRRRLGCAAATWAAAGAAEAAAWAAAWAAALSDLDRLIALNPGELDPLGTPIDSSEAGPLGPIWPHGVPEWYTGAATGTVTPHEEPSGDAD